MGQYWPAKPADELLPLVERELAKLGLNGGTAAVRNAITAVKTRSRTTLDVARQVAVRLDGKSVTLDEKALKEIAKDKDGYRAALAASVTALKKVEWTAEEIEHALRNLAQQRHVPAGKIFQPIRIPLTGGTVSEPVNERLAGGGKKGALPPPAAASLASR